MIKQTILAILIIGILSISITTTDGKSHYDYTTKIPNTDSMLPTLDHTMDLYFKIPQSESDVEVGI